MSLLLLLQGGLGDLGTFQVIVIVRRAGQDLAVPVSSGLLYFDLIPEVRS